MSLQDTLQTLEVFCELDENEIAEVAQIVMEKDVPVGQPLFVEAMKGETLFIVLEGTATVTRKLEDGREVQLYLAEAGDFLGSLSLFEPGERRVSAKTTEPSKILIIRRKDFLKLADKSPKTAFRFAFELVRASLEKLNDMAEVHVETIEQLKKG